MPNTLPDLGSESDLEIKEHAKFSSIFSLAILASGAAAAGVTACNGKAQGCIDQATASATSCRAGDWACGCKYIDKIQQAATSCVINACGDISSALGAAQEARSICGKQ
ncbi:hypothetical protein Cpir12675_002647 [Ceratocystis pirilliformis]|uniref:CFEM domain-containing protein n=1 Tax=Ceratocystis pirilliformis TaxID=259994 RepID=A0ABR3Z8U3_9PEZI